MDKNTMKISDVPVLSLKYDYVFALSSFLDDFYKTKMEEKFQLIIEEPSKGLIEKVHYCELAAAAHKLANDYNLTVPSWAMKDEYIMDYPIYAFGIDDEEGQDVLKEFSPYEFKIRNLFLGSNILTRV